MARNVKEAPSKDLRKIRNRHASGLLLTKKDPQALIDTKGQSTIFSDLLSSVVLDYVSHYDVTLTRFYARVLHGHVLADGVARVEVEIRVSPHFETALVVPVALFSRQKSGARPAAVAAQKIWPLTLEAPGEKIDFCWKKDHKSAKLLFFVGKLPLC